MAYVPGLLSVLAGIANLIDGDVTDAAQFVLIGVLFFDIAHRNNAQ